MIKGALGILETYGYVGAVEAADAAVKAANVKVLGMEKVRGGLVTVEVVGEVAAVKAAVDAAVGAVTRLGVSITSHVIPRPIAELWDILPKEKEPEVEPSSEEEKESLEEKETKEEVQPNHLELPKMEEPKGTDNRMEADETLENMRVVELRKLARELDTSIPRGEIKYANKKDLIKAIREFYKKQGGK